MALVGRIMYESMHSLKLIGYFCLKSTKMALVNALLFPLLGCADVTPDAIEDKLNDCKISASVSLWSTKI